MDTNTPTEITMSFFDEYSRRVTHLEALITLISFQENKDHMGEVVSESLYYTFYNFKEMHDVVLEKMNEIAYKRPPNEDLEKIIA